MYCSNSSLITIPLRNRILLPSELLVNTEIKLSLTEYAFSNYVKMITISKFLRVGLLCPLEPEHNLTDSHILKKYILSSVKRSLCFV